jgi:hypothetical protein
MFREVEHKKTNPITVIVMLILFVIGMVWLVPAALSGDLRWFLPGVDGTPSEIIIWKDGEKIILPPDDPDFAPITAAAHAAVSNIFSNSDFGASEQTLQTYYHSFALELFYPAPIQIHSRFNMGRPRQIMLPMTGVGYEEGRFLVGANGQYWAGGPRTAKITAVREAVAAALTRRGVVVPTPGPVADYLSPTPVVTPATVPPTLTPSGQPGALGPGDTWQKLTGTSVQARSLISLTQWLKLKSRAPLPETVNAEPPNYRVGDRHEFWVSDQQARTYYTVTAELKEITAHAYWYVADGYDVSVDDLKQSAQLFESKIYPTNRATFGSEPQPGIDNDPHITVLNAPLTGAGGYFSSADMYPTQVNPFSNQRKMIYISSPPGTNFYNGTLAHEFQHMIHWNMHADQDVWLNEGFAELAMALNGFPPGGPEVAFAQDPDVQLTDWADDNNQKLAHYGAAYLFSEYLYQHYGGGKVIQAVLDAAGRSDESVSSALATLGEADRFPEVFRNWTVANYLDEKQPGGRYEYPGLDITVPASDQITQSPGAVTGTVRQHAADYIEIDPAAATGGALEITFQGNETAPVLSSPPPAGQGFWFSNRGDIINSQMSRFFDFRDHQGPLTLNFSLWYDIEPDFDYGYLMASTDDGISWTTLPGRHTTDTNPNGTNLGHGWTGTSGADPAWIEETMDLSAYAGKIVQLRFDYVTDDSYNAQGFAVDNLRILEVDYQADAETDDGDWNGRGFVHIGNEVSQQFYLTLITFDKDDRPAVTPVQVDGKNSALTTISSFGNAVRRATLVVAAAAPKTIQPAQYTVRIAPASAR